MERVLILTPELIKELKVLVDVAKRRLEDGDLSAIGQDPYETGEYRALEQALDVFGPLVYLEWEPYDHSWEEG